ncbi:MAG: hypothetical protein AVO35_10195 [Candidatus Aegiribacteria sp. MLS_C]|nr:MAG: hypothetical protein AVO35_10195 [Candidatus Aegiribacteria sp. MLS_C]
MDSPDLLEIVQGLVDEAGLLLVDLSVRNTGRKYMIRLLVDRPGRVTVMECAGLSRELQDTMDQNLLFSGWDYRLEVSSPGVGRPLSGEVDWIRSVGRRLSVRLEGEDFVDWLEDYGSGLLKFSDGREISAESIVSAVEVLEQGPSGDQGSAND